MAMSWKAMDKILYFIVPMIVLLGIYCGQTSNEISGYFQPYNVKNSSDIMIISVDNSTYKQGQTIQIVGKVNDYNEGGTVQIRIVDPSRNEVSSFSGLLNEFGIFYGSFAIPETFSSGKYLINAYYEGDPNKNLITLKVNISNAPKGVVYISIPFGASTQENKINFDPQTIDIQQGTKIVWINYDNTVHTVISGKINDDGTLSVDGRLKGGFIAPGEKLTIVPANPAKYSYFCKIHPWLEGFVSVKASPDTSKAKVS